MHETLSSQKPESKCCYRFCKQLAPVKCPLYHVLRKRTSAREVERTQTQIVLNLSGMLYFAPVSTLYTTRLFFFSNTTLTVYVSININLVKQCPIKTLHENHYKGLHLLLILVILSKNYRENLRVQLTNKMNSLQFYSHINNLVVYWGSRDYLFRTCSPPISLPAVCHRAEHGATCDAVYAWRPTDSHTSETPSREYNKNVRNS